jgi:hypothetical protein
MTRHAAKMPVFVQAYQGLTQSYPTRPAFRIKRLRSVSEIDQIEVGFNDQGVIAAFVACDKRKNPGTNPGVR